MYRQLLEPMKRIILATILATLVLSGIAAPLTSAQSTPNTGQALEIGPPVLNLTADPGQVLTAEISIRDIATTDLIVTNEINDFGANGEDGTPQILLDRTEESPFSIRSWVSPIDQLQLAPKEIQLIPITIFVPEDAAPGGYYGIIRFTGTPANLEGSGVALTASLGTLVFIRVNGDAKEQLVIEDFYANSQGNQYPLYEYKPITLTTLLKNEGNIYEQPTGTLNLKDMFGKTILTSPINAEERLILPDSTRKFDTVVDDSAIGGGLMFGYYTADVTIKYGSNGQEITQTTGFWVIPYTIILLIIIALVAAFFIFRFLLRRYNQSVIRRAGGYRGGGGYNGPRQGGGPRRRR